MSLLKFTPLNAEQTKRLSIPIKDVEILSGELFSRGVGKKAVVKIKGKTFNVIGLSCGLPNCQCDSKLVEVAK